jgi:hypothetical protein
MEQCT